MKASLEKRLLGFRLKKYVAEIRMMHLMLFIISYICLSTDYSLLTSSLNLKLLWVRSFSLPEFRDEVQEVVRPVLTAYYKVSLKLS